MSKYSNSSRKQILSCRENGTLFIEPLEENGFIKYHTEDGTYWISDFFKKKIEIGDMFCTVDCSVNQYDLNGFPIGNAVSLSSQTDSTIEGQNGLIILEFDSNLECAREASLSIKYLINNHSEIMNKLKTKKTIKFIPKYLATKIIFVSYNTDIIFALTTISLDRNGLYISNKS